MFAKGFAEKDYYSDAKYDLTRGQEERRPNSEVWQDPWTWVEASEQSLKSFPIFFGILISFASFK
jgi:hypothetical protein